MRRLTAGAVLAVLCVLAAGGAGPATPGWRRRGARSSGGGRVLLVLPFDNRTGQPSLEWMREAAAEILSMRFASAGFQPTSRADRVYALDHLGLPQGFQPSRASALKLAQTLDADSIVVGSYTTDGTSIVAQASLVDVPNLRMLPAVSVRGEMRDLMGVFSALAWQADAGARPHVQRVRGDVCRRGTREIRLDAFEQYIRGITEPDQAERQRHLEQAVKLSPGFSPAWMALGREDYNQQQYTEAAEAFAKVDHGGADGLGSRLLPRAFAAVFRRLRPGRTGVCRRGAGTAAGRGGEQRGCGHEPAGERRHVAVYSSGCSRPQCSGLPLQPGAEPEAARECAGRDQRDGAVPETAARRQRGPGAGRRRGKLRQAPRANSASDPLERIVRSFDAAAFKQAAAVMDEMNAGRLEALAPRDRAQALCTQAKGYLDRGLLLEAERLYQAAVAADGKSAEAHAGLAEVRERSGDADAARKEAQTSLTLGPSANAYLVLAQLDLAAGNLGTANTDANNALKLDPANRTAQDILRQIAGQDGAEVDQ